MKYFRAFLLFVIPSFILQLFQKNLKVGFSVVIVDSLKMLEGSQIGHFNFIFINKLEMGKKACVNMFNFIKGDFSILMDTRAEINLQNKISRILNKKFSYEEYILKLGYHAKIGVKHLIDMASSIEIGDNSMLAGAESQIWTHGFYFSKQGEKVTRIDGAVKIGNNCYIGARSIISAGITIANAVTVGAGTIISKDLDTPGLYVSQPVRFIPFDPDEAEKKLGTPVANFNGVNIYKKK